MISQLTDYELYSYLAWVACQVHLSDESQGDFIEALGETEVGATMSPQERQHAENLAADFCEMEHPYSGHTRHPYAVERWYQERN